MLALNVYNEIADLLSHFVTRIQIVAGRNRHDINVASENVVCQLFRVVYGWKGLRNLNTEGIANFPGLDLADDVARIGIQVTSSTTSLKVKETLEQVIAHRYYEKYDRVIVYILTQKKPINEGKDWSDLLDGKFHFSAKDDIWDSHDVLQKIESLDIDQMQEVLFLLKKVIGEFNHTLSSPPSSDFFVPPPRTQYFTGRETVLENLHQALSQAQTVALTQALVGLGGIGKTQTALAYADRCREAYRYVYWANAESFALLQSEFASLAKRLFPEVPDNIEEAALLFQKWLTTESDYLLILDNADDPTAIKSLLPSPRTGRLLITSRMTFLDELGVDIPIPLGVLSESDALQFLVKRVSLDLENEGERSAATALSSLLGYLPLALEQAAAYIRHRRISLAQYRTEWLDKHGPIAGDYQSTVHKTWEKNFQAVEEASPAAAELLRHSAFLAPDPIPYSLFLKGISAFIAPLSDLLIEATSDPNALYELLSSLADYSLIEQDNEREVFSIHRLVQQVVRESLEPQKTEYMERMLEGDCEILSRG